MAWNFYSISLETNDKTKTSRILIDYFNEEIDSVKKCAECYRNANDAPDNWFTLVCDEPHLIVWAKMKGNQMISYQINLTIS